MKVDNVQFINKEGARRKYDQPHAEPFPETGLEFFKVSLEDFRILSAYDTKTYFVGGKDKMPDGYVISVITEPENLFDEDILYKARREKDRS